MSKSKAKSKTTRRKSARRDPAFDKYIALIERQPYVSTTPSGRNWWAVPNKGDYGEGNIAGKAAAWAYLKLLRDSRELGRPWNGGTLQHIAFDMLKGGARNSARRGQVVSFFSTLDYVLGQAVALDSGLDSVSYEKCGEMIRKPTSPDLSPG